MKITFKQKAKCGAKEGNPDKIFNSFNTITGALLNIKTMSLVIASPKISFCFLLGTRNSL